MKRRLISVSKLAEALGTSRAAVSRVLDEENTSISLTTLLRTAMALGCKVRLESSRLNVSPFNCRAGRRPVEISQIHGKPNSATRESLWRRLEHDAPAGSPLRESSGQSLSPAVVAPSHFFQGPKCGLGARVAFGLNKIGPSDSVRMG